MALRAGGEGAQMSGWKLELLRNHDGGAWLSFEDIYGEDRVYQIHPDLSVFKQVWADDAFTESNPDPEPDLVPVILARDLLNLLQFLENRAAK